MNGEKRICLNQSVLDFMDDKIDSTSIVLEFGSGWSSLWFAERCGELFTVETHPAWVRMVEKELQQSGNDNWNMIKCCINMNRYQSKVENGYSYDYETADLVLIDSREDLRRAATEVAWALLKPGGWLLFDDAQRRQHRMTIGNLIEKSGAPTRLVWQSGDIESAMDRLTLAWRKPND